ncbi:MAG TPA: hypothetical protein QGF41_12070 [Gammaproteobacteria bacterium]|nr:hypothetical protein [Gammaproteobacteria bacterium]
MPKKVIIFISLLLLFVAQPAQLQDDPAAEPLLTVMQIMTAIITPMTATIWGAYELQTDAEWLEIENAALTVIAAGNLLTSGGASDAEQAAASEADWLTYNNQMIAAARAVITAVGQKDEEALFAAGNDALYPPCESCHQQYQQQ